MSTLPSIFVSHGSPMMAVTESPARAFLAALGKTLPRPKAIVVASAHWEEHGAVVGGASQPATIHDFYGFPEPLYRIRYPAPGDTALSRRVADMLETTIDAKRGFDHGVWSPLILMYPEADIPVIPVALDDAGDATRHLEIGRKLAPLREEGVLVMGSGSFTHNLGALRSTPPGQPTPAWTTEFIDWTVKALEAGDTESLEDWEEKAPHALQNHPTPEHFMPLFVAAGAGGKAELLHESVHHGILAMHAFAFQ
ncbi:MAG: dioxygenase [Alphaproteobacteria bacterium]|nr:dioxygenase [Alphaproteobacteria bacterium]